MNKQNQYYELSNYISTQIVETQKRLEECKTAVSELESDNIQYSTFAVTFNPNIEDWKKQVEMYDVRLKWLNIQLETLQYVTN